MKLYAGTSGWSYKNFQPGFYPEFAKSADWLEVYATKLPTVELNSSFYKLPSPVVIAKWRQAVPPEFRFSVKAWQRITHEKRLVDCGEELAAINMVMRAFGENLGVVLFQLPPSLEADNKLLENFVLQLDGSGKYTFEFRHKSWFCESVMDILRKYNIALTLSHTGNWNVPLIRTADFVYVRLHGPHKAYEGVYDKEFISRLNAWLQKAGAAENYVYFNNTKTGTAAVDNAAELLSMFNQKP